MGLNMGEIPPITFPLYFVWITLCCTIMKDSDTIIQQNILFLIFNYNRYNIHNLLLIYYYYYYLTKNN